MSNEKLVLTFPKNVVREPVVYKLVKDYDLVVNILKANISPDEAGHMVLELVGPQERLKKGKAYLERAHVSVEPLSKDVRWLEDSCVHCTACVSVCPTNALALDRKSMQVSFDSKKCIACELCIPVCAYKAIEIQF